MKIIINIPREQWQQLDQQEVDAQPTLFNLE